MTIMRKLSMAVVGAAFVALGTVGSAQAGTFISTSSGQVGTVDPSTGAFTQLGSLGPAFFDIALSNDNNLFGNDSSGTFFSINPVSGSSSLIGIGAFVNGLGFSISNVLYGTGGSGFYTIDTTTGGASLVASIAGFNSSGDIAFDPVNNRFLATSSGDSLWSIALNGVGTKIGEIGFGGVYGLIFDQGTLFGYTSDRKQIVIDPATGVGTFNKNVTGVNGAIYGTASLPSTGPINSVPEPGTVFGLLAFGAMGVGSMLKRKQQQKATVKA